jgi:SAM-dependent methyltransferase
MGLDAGNMLTTQEFVNALRTEEINGIVARHRSVFAAKDLLEIGSGAGAQLLVLRRICRSAIGIENSNRADRLTDIVNYDGRGIPFPDASFDVVFSSHVIEHIRDELSIHAEMHRVLRPGGVCVHIVPTAAWRVLASILHYPALVKKLVDKLSRPRHAADSAVISESSTRSAASRWRSRLSYALIQQRHGEFGNWATEHFLFRVSAWHKRFEANGWHVELSEPVGFVQSGHDLLNEWLSWRGRRLIARTLGSSSFVFFLRGAS